MKRISPFGNKNSMVVILILFGFAVAMIIFSIVGAQAGKTLPLPPTPVTPNPFTSKISPTPTPDLYGVRLSTPGELRRTPIVPSSTIDLSPAINRVYKFDIYVQHPDGNLTLFLIGPAPSGYDGAANLPEEILQNLPLKEGDDILYWQPPSPWRRVEPPTITVEAYPSPTLTLGPYPKP